MAGHDANTLVQTPAAPNRLADELSIVDYPETTAQNVSGSLMADRNAIIDWFGRFLPVGFYYRAFYKPFGVWHWWERLIRVAAGLGVANLSSTPRYQDKQYLFCDVAVVGAGPAGLSAALKAAEAGASVLLIDEQPELGGSLTYHRFAIDSDAVRGEAEALLPTSYRIPISRCLLMPCVTAGSPITICPSFKGIAYSRCAPKVVFWQRVAVSSTWFFAITTCPGVVLCSALDRMINHYAVAPQGALVVLAGNDQAWMTAFTAAEAGLSVAAVVDLRDAPDDAALLAEANARGMTVHMGATVYTARRDSGSQSLCGVDIHRIDAQGQVG
jgi:sarcosine oxidase subunit alpha